MLNEVTFDSEALGELLDLAYCPTVQVQFQAEWVREAIYDTPLGTCMGEGFSDVQVLSCVLATGQDVTKLYESSPTFQKEIEQAIKEKEQRL